jgi:hypothetical protein
LTRNLNLVLLGLLVVVVAPFCWLMLNASTRGVAPKPVTLQQLRQLAGTLPGEAPTQVRYEVIGRRPTVSDLLAAGSGLRTTPFMIRAYALVLPDGRTITIDRGITRDLAQDGDVRDFDPRAQSTVARAVAAAPLALVLSPDLHHSGRENADPALGSGLDHDQLEPHQPPYAAAPGVVVVPAYGVGPGERMVYTRLADGSELLFTGDIAPVEAAWSQLRPPARLVTSVFVDHDREEIGAWLRTIEALKRADGTLQIVTGHGVRIPHMLVHGFAGSPAANHPQ